jgi:iron complex transport system ATP-binding protein
VSAVLLQTTKLRIEVPGRVLVDEFDSSVTRGEFVALLGGNGTGKSLLLRTLAGLRVPNAGTIRLDAQDIDSLPRRSIATRLGFLPQDPDAAPQGTLLDSVMLGRYAHLGFWELSGPQDESRARNALHDTGLDSFGARELATLSGGEQRRAAIARLLVQAPSVYLMDEPTNHLDPAQQVGILERLHQLTRADCAVIASLHDPNLALRFADRLWLLSGSGKVTTVARADLEAQHLAELYGIDYAETRLGEFRFMAPGRAVHNRR